MTRIKLCGYDELQCLDSKGLVITTNKIQLNLFIVRKDRQIFIYENSCPHTSAPLDWLPDSFLNEDKSYIMCANHGALFEIEDGLCVYGPCRKQRLRTLPHVLENDNVYLIA